MVGNETLFACRTIFGGYQNTTCAFEKVHLQQVGCCACAQQECGLRTHFLDFLPQKEHRRHANATANEQETLVGRCGKGERIAQWKHAIKCFASLQRRHLVCAVTHSCH